MKIWKTMGTLLIAALLMGCPPSPGKNTHTVTFESNSGSAVASQEVTEGDHAAEPTAPTRIGYALYGWYSDSGLSNAWTFGSDTVNSDITLYAKWVIAYTVTFESNSGSAVTSQEVAEGTHAAEPTAPTRRGYAFYGWYSDSGLSNAWTFGSDTVNSDITLYAKWEIAYTVTFNSIGGSAVPNQQVKKGDHADKPTDPTRGGYTFVAWHLNSALSNVVWNFESDEVNTDITLFAEWEIVHTVTFDPTNGSPVSSQQVGDGDYAPEPAPPPTRNNYAFGGWYSDESLTTAWSFGSNTVDKDITLYAKWLPLYTVTFDSNGGNGVDSQQVAKGGHAAEPEAPTKSDHAFYGWYSDSGLSDAWAFKSDIVNTYITLYAKWVEVLDINIGDTGPAGGIIFYDKGSYSDGWRYLEAAPSDQGSSVGWGGYRTEVGGTGTGIGSGKSNTEKIVNTLGSGNYAARLCYDLELGGYDDWFLPSKDELNELYNRKGTVRGFASSNYWSSSEYNSILAGGQAFSDGTWNANYDKTNNKNVRAVRAF